MQHFPAVLVFPSLSLSALASLPSPLLAIQRPALTWVTPWQEHRRHMWTRLAFDLPFYANPECLKGFYTSLRPLSPHPSLRAVDCCLSRARWGGSLPDLAAESDGRQELEGLATKCENERFALSALGRGQQTRPLVGHVCTESALRIFFYNAPEKEAKEQKVIRGGEQRHGHLSCQCSFIPSQPAWWLLHSTPTY